MKKQKPKLVDHSRQWEELKTVDPTKGPKKENMIKCPSSELPAWCYTLSTGLLLLLFCSVCIFTYFYIGLGR